MASPLSRVAAAHIDQDDLLAMVPLGCVLKPWHVVLRETDEVALHAAIAHLPEPMLRLKSATGRRVLHRADVDSLQGNAEHELNWDVPVRHGFVQIPFSNRARSSHSA